ncbi:unnamed protein product [Caenorhabditis bovis]|uniref:G-patch domain-containing protein n=1 Tax=Caenorhabditis bovis TaxID=2654633 RepID=A0A8S1EPL3_9PELO|nr:unnamed protein product [Caenorhabditis bovis]
MDLFDGGTSIADILRDAANEVLHANIPPGFVYIDEYGQYYSHESGLYYDPNTFLYYHPENMTYYKLNEQIYEYEIVECVQPTKWSSNNYRKRAIEAVGEDEFKKFNQDSVDICEIVFKLIGKILKQEHMENPESQRNISKPVKEITADDIRKKLRKRKRHVKTVFDEASGCFVELETSEDAEENSDEHQKHDADEESDDDKEVLHGDERAIFMKEERFSEAPLIRIIDHQHKLSIVTLSGGYIGSDPDCEVLLYNRLLPERCAEISYNSEIRCFNLAKIDDGCVIQCNSIVVKTDSPVDICHGDVVIISGERLDFHVHFGSNTCPGCEPGLIMSKETDEEITGQAKYISGELARRKNLKKMMRSYGITPDEKLNGPIRKADKKPISGLSYINIERSNDPYGSCAAKPVPESQRKFDIPSSSAKSSEAANIEKPLDRGNIGFKLLKSMGWSEGKGLGKDELGKVEPVATAIKNNRQGLGAPTEKKPKSYKESILEKTRERFNQVYCLRKYAYNY